jgi:hypothetical protein
VADELTDQIIALAERATECAASAEAATTLREVRDRLEGPIRLAIAGKVKAGKSTLLNALIGEELAPTDAGECTRILTWYRYSDRPYARLHTKTGESVERPFTRHGGALEVDLGGRDAAQVDHLEVGWPTRRLADLVLIDTPGIASLSTDVSARTHESMSAESGDAPVADAVLYLLRHTHATDLRFLEAFHDDDVARGTPVNTVGVLSRADEIGSSDLDAMEVAARVADRYQSDPRLHRLCPVVVPVNGLLGHAAATLREAEYAALAKIAALPEGVEQLLLTADRFATMPGVTDVPPEVRSALLDRLGLFGVRLSVELLRTRVVSTSTELAARLADSSGLERLRAVVLMQFQTRARILKARSALAALQNLVSRGACRDADDLLGRLEQVTAGAHEFEEIRVLLELRSGELTLPPARARELDLLMGGSGHDRATRLGMSPGAAADEETAAMDAALRTWQSVERHPLSSRSVQLAARAATRTVEGFLAERVR